MKKLRLIFLLLAFCSSLFAQQATDSLKSQEYYFNKSQTQKLFAWPLIVAGIGMTTVGIINWMVYGLVDTFTGGDHRRSRIGAATAIAGGAAIGGSISLFSSARRNKQRAADMNMYLERLPITGMAGRPPGIGIPTVRLRIPL